MIVEHYVFDPVEEKKVTFDFTSDLESGETFITGNVTMLSKLEVGEDEDDPTDILDGSHSLTGNVVSQGLIDLEDDTIYLVECTILTSAGRTLQRSSRIIVRDE